MHIGIVGPIHLPSIKIKDSKLKNSLTGMGGTPVNHQINALLDEGHRISVFSLSPELKAGEEFELHEENLSIYMGPFRKRARHRCIDLFAGERFFLKSKILESKPEIIHAHWQYEWAWAALDSKIPTLVTCHDSPVKILQVHRNLYRLIRLIMAKIVLHKAKYITAVSPYTASGLKFFTNTAIKIIPNFEPDEVFNIYTNRKSITSALKIAMVNNGFYGLKNVSNGIKAFVEFQKKFPKAELHLFGNGNGVDQDAQNWCSVRSWKENIHFRGDMDFNDLIKEFSKADVLLHTSREESCPMVVIEAFAFGMPVIGGKDSGGIPWMIEEDCGLLVDVEDTESILQSLLKLNDPEIYKDYSLNARCLALRRFSKNIVLKQYLDFYKLISKDREPLKNVH